MNLTRTCFVPIVTILVWIGGQSQAEEIIVSGLSADQRAAMESIRESEVLATVSFLASDEMAGRNTPSVELNIASAYVAARFRGAGLEKVAPEDSFYQTAEYQQFGNPQTDPVVLQDGRPVVQRGLLFGSATGVDLTADGVDFDSVSGDGNGMTCSGRIVIVDDFSLPPQAVNSPAMVLAAWSRRLVNIMNEDAAAVLIRITDDSRLPEIAHRLRTTPVTLPERFLPKCPMILVSADSVTRPSAGESLQLSVKSPARTVIQHPVHNVIGLIRGSDPQLSEQAIVISAHLDHIGVLTDDRDGDRINNGADDNATGVTGVLALADAFSRLPVAPRRSLLFVTFWGEEQGLLGSSHYVEQPPWPLENTIANINFEMLGRPEPDAEGKAWGTGWKHSTLCDLVAVGAARADVAIFHREDVSEMLYTRSDNYPFVRRGVIAHSFSAGSLHSDYHRPTDEVDRLNIPHMTKVLRGLFAGVLPIADGELTPQKIAGN